jgi:hypothetical protein
MKSFLPIAATLPVLLSASAAMAGTYSGNWPLTVTHAQHIDGKYCLTLTDDGSLGWPHSGEASMPGLPYGTFQLIEHKLTVVIQEQGEGQNAGWVFSPTAGNGSVGKGSTVVVYGGEALDSGAVVFGKKGGC